MNTPKNVSPWEAVALTGVLMLTGCSAHHTPTTLKKLASSKGCDADAVALSPSGKLAAVTCTRGFVDVYRVPDLKQLGRLQAKEGRAFQSAFFPNRDLIAVAEWAGGVTLWDTARWRKVAEISIPGRTNAVALSPDGDWLASCVGADDRSLIVWKTKGYREVYRFKSQGADIIFGSGFSCVAFLDSQTLAAGGLDGCVYIWDLQAGRLLKRLCGHTRPIWRIATLPAQGMVASGSMDHTVVVWDWQQGKQVISTPGLVVAACPAKGLLAVSSGTGPVVLQLWDVKSSRVVASRKVEEQNILDMAFSAEGNHLVTVGNGESVIIWRIQ